jgi:DNA-binding PadR family transcriptional regulator
VLAALETEPAHGYAIIRRLRTRSNDVFRLAEGTVYPTLHRLERDGLVKSRWTAASGRRRRVYRITGSGRDHARGLSCFRRARPRGRLRPDRLLRARGGRRHVRRPAGAAAPQAVARVLYEVVLLVACFAAFGRRLGLR